MGVGGGDVHRDGEGEVGGWERKREWEWEWGYVHGEGDE